MHGLPGSHPQTPSLCGPAAAPTQGSEPNQAIREGRESPDPKLAA